jgi:hypothetical protein
MGSRASSHKATEEDDKMSMLVLPSDVSQRICSLLHDPNPKDIANFHMVNTCMRKAYLQVPSVNPQFSSVHFAMSSTAQQHSLGNLDRSSAGSVTQQGPRCTTRSHNTRASSSWRCYPLRHLSTVELPYCDLGSFPAQVHGRQIQNQHGYACQIRRAAVLPTCAVDVVGLA